MPEDPKVESSLPSTELAATLKAPTADIAASKSTARSEAA
jgi:hypothetical protein